MTTQGIEQAINTGSAAAITGTGYDPIPEDDLNYVVTFIKPLETSDGRKLSGVELKPISYGQYRQFEGFDNVYDLIDNIVAKQMEIDPKDLGQLDMRDWKKIKDIVANFLPYSVI